MGRRDTKNVAPAVVELKHRPRSYHLDRMALLRQLIYAPIPTHLTGLKQGVDERSDG